MVPGSNPSFFPPVKENKISISQFTNQLSKLGKPLKLTVNGKI
jgi:hypothetical protein